MFEESLAGRERILVYTKKDLGSSSPSEDAKVDTNTLLHLQALADKVSRDMLSFISGISRRRSSSPITKPIRMRARYLT